MVFTGDDAGRYLASAIAIELSIISNFILNNFWTFASRADDTHLGLKGLKFNLVSFVALGVSFTTFFILTHFFGFTSRGQELIAQAIGIIPATVMNYFLNSYWTWKGKQQ